MARFQSQVYTIIRGSVGGVTYTANQWHQLIARARTSPVNPSTTNQGVIRSAMGQVSSAWKNLTDAQRQAWDEYAQGCEYSGPMGKYSIPGRQMFCGVLSLAQYIDTRELYDLTIVPTPPVIPGFFGIGPVISSTPITVGTGIALSVGNSTGEDGVALVERSRPFEASRLRYKGPFISETAIAEICTDAASTLVEMMELEVDKIYFTRIRCITEAAPFRISAEYIFRHTAVTISV